MLALAPTQTLAGRTKGEFGTGFTTTVCVAVAEHPELVTVKLTVFDPLLPQFTVCGPTPVAVKGEAPNPKFQEYVEPAAAVPVYVTVAFAIAQTVVGFTVNEAVGVGLTVIF